MRRLRVVVEAYACRPDMGSEPGIGWNVAHALAEWHDVDVITSARNRAAIERAASRDSRVRIHGVALPRGLEWLAAVRGLRLVHAYVWPWFAWRCARRLHRARRFDVAHRLTLGTWRYPSQLGRLEIPFVFGPIGGGECVPPRLRSVLGWRGRCVEGVRALAQQAARVDPFVRRSMARADAIVAASRDTATFIAERFGRDAFVLPAAGHDERAVPSRSSGGPFTAVTVGVLEARKATALAIRAFGRARAALPDGARLVVIGDGPERARLERLANAVAPGAVTFAGHLPRDAVSERLAGAHALLFPSVRDSGGVAILEAFAHGVPVIALDHAGPGALVAEDAGVRVPVGSPMSVVQGLAAALVGLANDPVRHKWMARNAKRAASACGWRGKAAVLARLLGRVAGERIAVSEESTQSGPVATPMREEEASTCQGDNRCVSPPSHSRGSRSPFRRQSPQTAATPGDRASPGVRSDRRPGSSGRGSDRSGG